MLRKRSTMGPSARLEAQALSDELGWLEQIARHGGEISFGAPTRCPNCANYGFVDGIGDGVQRNHCLGCGCQWTFSIKSLALFQESFPPRSSTGQRVVGGGVLVDGLDVDGWAKQTSERFTDLRTAMRNTRRSEPEDT